MGSEMCIRDRAYSIKKSSIRSDILKLLKKNINSKRKYNHLLRIALTKNMLSISLRKRIKPKLNLDLKLVNLKRQKPEYKNLKYKEILKYLSKLDNSKSDIGLCSNKMIFETGTSNLLFIKNGKIYSPINKFYKGITSVSYTHLRAQETDSYLVCRLLLEKN